MTPEKFEKIVLLLSSDQQGEVFAAAQAIGRALPSANLDWHKFAKLVAGRLGAKAPPETPPEQTKQYAQDWKSRQGENGQYVTREEREIVNRLRTSACALNDAESSFIDDLWNKIEKFEGATFISEKQRKWLHRIWERA